MDSYFANEKNKYQNKKPNLAIFMMGVPGSGKTTILNHFVKNILGILLNHIYISEDIYDYSLDNFIVCNPDLIVQELDGYKIQEHKQWIGKGCKLNNSLLKNILDPNQVRYNFIYDSTGSQYGNYLKKIQQAQDLNYFTILLDIRCNLLTCYERMLNRSRKVNFNTIQNLYERIYTPKINHFYENMNHYDILKERVDVSIIIENEEKIKIIDIDTPELNIRNEILDFQDLTI